MIDQKGIKFLVLVIVVLGIGFILLENRTQIGKSQKEVEHHNLLSPSPPAKVLMKEGQPHPTPPSPDFMSVEEFKKYAEGALASLPTKNDIKGMTSKDVHEMPMKLIDKVRPAARVADIIAANPALEKEAASFYQRCALIPEGLTSVRAQCLGDYRLLAAKNNIAVNLNDYPEEVVRDSEPLP